MGFSSLKPHSQMLLLLMWMSLCSSLVQSIAPSSTFSADQISAAKASIISLLPTVSVPSTNSCTLACRILPDLLPDDKVFTQAQPVYQSEQLYWSEQQSTTMPLCRVRPANALDVAEAIIVLQRTQCQFAVKNGGLTPSAGASNIEGGVIIDLELLDDISLSDDNKITYVGGGARWGQVYSYLEARSLSVVGGRNSELGVSGSTLGGGMSSLSGTRGWASDNVINYELIAPSGELLSVNQNSYPDLFFALRGGGNNFGIVARLDLNTFDHGLMWGGATTHTLDKNTTMYQALEDFNLNESRDPNAGVFTAAVATKGRYFMSNNYAYVNATVNPSILANFTSVPNIIDTTRITTQLNLAQELSSFQPRGFRQRFTTLTIKNSASLMGQMLDIWYTKIQPLVALNTPNSTLALTFQPLTLGAIAQFSNNGGNCLGITLSDGPLIIVLLSFQWTSDITDSTVTTIQNSIRDSAIALAKSQDMYHPFLYQNIASPDQDVFASYGSANQQKLQAIQAKYDPSGVWTKLQPGGFKVQN